MRKAQAKPRLAHGIAERRAAAPVTLNDRAYELLRLEILTFRLRPGERTSERLLAARYGLGMAAVRAALPRLVQEGFVEKSLEVLDGGLAQVEHGPGGVRPDETQAACYQDHLRCSRLP